MAAKFFGEFLIERGVITREILEEVLEIQRQNNQMLGEIAVNSGFISEQEANEINLRQQIQNKKFGEIAQELGLLDESQLETLLKVQREKRKLFGDIIVDLHIIDANQLEEHLAVHESNHDKAYQELLERIESHPLANYFTGTVETTNLLFIRALHEKSKFSEIVSNDHEMIHGEATCQIKIGEDTPIKVSLVASIETAAIIASKFTYQPVEDCDAEFSIDAFGEFLNIIIGHLFENQPEQEKLPRSYTELNIDIPTMCAEDEDILIAKIESQIGTILVIVSH